MSNSKVVHGIVIKREQMQNALQNHQEGIKLLGPHPEHSRQWKMVGSLF